MDLACGSVHINLQKKNSTNIFPVRTEQASSITSIQTTGRPFPTPPYIGSDGGALRDDTKNGYVASPILDSRHATSTPGGAGGGDVA